jgi:hypothetical protein
MWFNHAVFEEFVKLTISGRYRDVYLLIFLKRKGLGCPGPVTVL